MRGQRLPPCRCDKALAHIFIFHSPPPTTLPHGTTMLPTLPLLLAFLFLAATSPQPASAAPAKKKPTYGCPIPGISAVCPTFSRKSSHHSRSLEAAGVDARAYAPAVFAYLPVNASSFGSAAISTALALNSYTGGANEKGLHFHDTAPTFLRFAPTKDFAAVGRDFVASRFLDVAEAGDAPAPTTNADTLKVCKANKAEVYVANWTSASPFPGPPTAATVLGHLKRLAGALEDAGERFCGRTAWLMSYSPDAMATGRKYFEVSVDAGRCGSDGEDRGGACVEEKEVIAAGAAPALHLPTSE